MELKELAEAYAASWRNYGERMVRLSAADWIVLDDKLKTAVEMCSAYRYDLHRYPNVAGVGVSHKVKGNEVQDTPCIVVYVRKKEPSHKVTHPIPPDIHGVPTDVVEAGTPGLRFYAARARPIQPAYSIGHTHVTAGTLGCFVRDRVTEDVLILSNNHVLANSNNASTGDSIVQPGPYDGGRAPADTVAVLTRFKRINPGDNKVDAAVAKPSVGFSKDIPKIGVPQGVSRISRVGVPVQKAGRTTQNTFGAVVAFNASVFPIAYPGIGSTTFTEQIVTNGMSQSGDSGSLLVGLDRRACGLLFAGIGDPEGKLDIVTYYNDILNVQNELNVDIITA